MTVTPAAMATDYYVSPTGNNASAGTIGAPWQTIARVNSMTFAAGDRVLFQGGQTFTGMITLDAADLGTPSSLITITSYGTGRATISSSGSALYAYNTAGIAISNIDFVGTTGNTSDGVMFYADVSGAVAFDTISISQSEISGFGNYGLVIGSYNGLTGYRNVTVSNVSLHNNKSGGMQTYADTSAGPQAHQNFTVTRARVYDNPGKAGTNSSEGSGIIFGQVNHGMIDHSIAYNNGTLNTAGAGPVGIWAYGSNDITIQYNESHHNHTNNTDGGGFDLDGGTTNSVMQYNYSHDNDGAGFLIAGYSGATPNSGNVVRYNVSQNDGRSVINAGIYIWDGAGNMTGNFIDNNTVYVSGTATGFRYGLVIATGIANTKIRNNIIIASGANTAPVVVMGSQTAVSFENNNLFSTASASASTFGNASHTGDLTGDPLLTAPGTAGTLNNVDNLGSLTQYQLLAGSTMRDAGTDISVSAPTTPATDYYGNTTPRAAAYDVGAHEYQPVSFNKTAPTDGATNQSTGASLSWGAASGATGYAYCVTTTYGVCGSWTSNGTATTVAPSGLAASTTYFWQVRATVSGGTTYANNNSTAFWSFSTSSPVTPVVTTTAATSVSTTTATLNGTVNAGGTLTTTAFDYGTTVSYGSTIAAQSVSSGSPVGVSAAVSLSCGTQYHYRVRATNAASTAYGTDVTLTTATCAPGSAFVPADIDADRKSDASIYRPSTGDWIGRKSAGGTVAFAWGLAGDVPEPGDYDGDGKLDFAVYRPSTGFWYIAWSTTNFTTYGAYQWGGVTGDVPEPADYDGDRKTDIAFYRPSDGGWRIRLSSTSFVDSAVYYWGLSGDTPVPADYDGDGKADPAIYRPSTGGWWILKSSNGFNYNAYLNYAWGLAADLPVAADYDGDGKADPAIYRPTTGGWWILKSSTGYNYSVYINYAWGLAGDEPVPGDFDGDGKADAVIYRASTGAWWILQSSNGAYVNYNVGAAGDQPLLRR